MAKVIYLNGIVSVVLRVVLYDSSSTTGAGKTGLTSSSSGLIISTIADNEASATVYTAAGSTIESITTLGTFATPTATKCRFKEVDATNHPGLYEIQIANARYAVTSARSLVITIAVTGAAPSNAEIQLSAADLNDAVRLGLSGLKLTYQKNAAAGVIPFVLYDSAGAVVTGAGSLAGHVSIDGATQVSTTNAPTELANGIYLCNVVAADVNGKNIVFRFSGTGCVDAYVFIGTQPA